MSLSISVIVTRDLEEEDIELEPGRELLGFEEYRHSLWGAPIMRTLGLLLLPTLANHFGFELKDEELKYLQREAEIVRDNAVLIAAETGIEASRIRQYSENLLNAIQVARKHLGSVSVG
jgi:hypothetical protein